MTVARWIGFLILLTVALILLFQKLSRPSHAEQSLVRIAAACGQWSPVGSDATLLFCQGDRQ